MGKRKKEEVIVEFISGSAEGVTGSAVSITYPKKDKKQGKLLIEFGLIQGSHTILQDYQTNQKIVDKINAEEFEFVFVGHGHT